LAQSSAGLSVENSVRLSVEDLAQSSAGLSVENSVRASVHRLAQSSAGVSVENSELEWEKQWGQATVLTKAARTGPKTAWA
jgi:hypothetical protein